MSEQAFRSIDDVLRKEAGCTTEFDYTEQSSWLLFLRYLDELELGLGARAQIDGKKVTYHLDSMFQWGTCAARKDKGGRPDHNKADCGLNPMPMHEAKATDSRLPLLPCKVLPR